MKVKEITKYRITILRFVVQTISFILIFGGALGLSATFIVLPIMTPAGNPYTTTIGVWQLFELMVTAAIFPFIAITIITLGSLLFGRLFCGWVCPFGYISDIVSYVGKKGRVSRKLNDSLANFAIFMAFLFIFIDFSIGYNQAMGTSIYSYFGEFNREPYSVISPTSTLFSMLFWYFYLEKYPKSIDQLNTILSYSPVFWFRIFILVIAIIVNFYVPRAWCRYVCPLGGVMGVGGRFKVMKIWRDPTLCDESVCGQACVKSCPMGVSILDYKGHISDKLCISCGMCIDVCPTNGIYMKVR